MGVSDDPPGATYWRVSNGIRLTGMPAYKDVLTDTEMWQVSLSAGECGQALPPAAVDILNGKMAAAGAPNAAAEAIERGKASALAPVPAGKKP